MIKKRKHKLTLPVPEDALQAAILRYVYVEPTGCWRWLGGSTVQGYGRFTCVDLGYVNKPAHRVCYEAFVGPIPNGLNLLHSCDNPWCVNYSHLWPGTQAENVQDAAMKGHMGKCRGSSRPLAKITETEAALIRHDARPQRTIALDYGISQPIVSRIKSGQLWKHS